MIPPLCSISCVKQIILLPITFLLVILLPADAFSERPFFVTERAVPTKKGIYRFDGGLSFNRVSDSEKNNALIGSIRYGLIHNLEFALEIPYLFVETGGSRLNQQGDTVLDTKVRFIKGRAANPLSIAGQMSIKFPTAGREARLGTTGVVDVGFRAIASKEFTPLTTHINLGYFFIGNPAGGDESNQLRYALGLEFEILKTPLRFIGELFGQSNVDNGLSDDHMAIMGGFSFQAKRKLFIDFSAGFGLAEDAPDYTLSTGASYYFH